MEKSVSLFSLYEHLTHAISTMAYVRNNFYTVSSAVQIYLTEGNSAYSNYNVGDASKSLNHNRTESMNLKIMNQETNKHRA